MLLGKEGAAGGGEGDGGGGSDGDDSSGDFDNDDGIKTGSHVILSPLVTLIIIALHTR